MEWHYHKNNASRRFFKLASVKSVQTACVCIVFFFHYFKYYGHLIAKVERKQTLYLKMKLSCIRKKREARHQKNNYSIIHVSF